MLHTPIYDVRTRAFCGPTAISAVTGAPVSQIREIVRGMRGTKSNGHALAIMGMYPREIVIVMAKLGWRVVQSSGTTDNRDNPRDVFRLGDFLDHVQLGRYGGDSEGYFIVTVTNHYYAVGGGEICDTRTQLPMPIHKFKRGRRCWILNWWRFENNS